MKRFSTVDFEGELYIFPGKADEYTLKDFNILQDRLMEYDSTETLNVYIDVYHFNDGEDSFNGDISDEDTLADIDENFSDYFDEGLLIKVSSQKYELPGALPMPAEDYYGLEGEERETFIANKKAIKDAREAIEADMRAKGYSDEEIEHWFRYDYWFDEE